MLLRFLRKNRNSVTESFDIPRTTSTMSGFTLLEVIIAMAIMAVAFGSILAVEGGSIRASARAKQMNVVSMLARNQMVEAEFKVQGKTFEEVPASEEGVFKEPYKDYRWKQSVKELKFPSLASAFGGGSKGEDGDSKGGGGGQQGDNTEMVQLLAKLTSNFLSKALREVTVTVFWKEGKAEQSFSLTTYWVDLNYEFKLSE